MRELTKNRGALLALMLTNPDKAYYLQEIGRLIGKKPGCFQRTINKMVEEGILSSEYKANARFFKADKDYPFYKELRSIVFKAVGPVGRIRDLLNKTGRVSYAFVYGSFAKGKDKVDSDIDLIVVGQIDEDRLIKEMDRLEEALRREINFKIYTPRQFKVEIEAGEPFLMEVLQDKKTMIVGSEDELRKISKR